MCIIPNIITHNLKAEKVLGRKSRMNLFYYHCILYQNLNWEKFATSAFHHSFTQFV